MLHDAVKGGERRYRDASDRPATSYRLVLFHENGGETCVISGSISLDDERIVAGRCIVRQLSLIFSSCQVIVRAPRPNHIVAEDRPGVVIWRERDERRMHPLFRLGL